MAKMTCCCCGNYCPAMKQWHNRDNGFSICTSCISSEKQRGTTDAELEELYGLPGVHYVSPD